MPSPGLRTSRAQYTRQLLQASALRLAAERGYEATTIDDVAAAAGVSRRTVFNYFPTKVALFVHTPQTPAPEAIEAFIHSDGDILDDLATLLSSSDTQDRSNAEDFRTLRHVLCDNPALIYDIHTSIRHFHSVIRTAVARRLGTDPADVRTLALSALAAALHKSAVDLWAGELQECDDVATTPPSSVPAPTSTVPDGQFPANRCPATGLRRATDAHTQRPDCVADAIHLMTSTLKDVLADYRPASNKNITH